MQINSKSKYKSLFLMFPEFHELKPKGKLKHTEMK